MRGGSWAKLNCRLKWEYCNFQTWIYNWKPLQNIRDLRISKSALQWNNTILTKYMVGLSYIKVIKALEGYFYGWAVYLAL